MKISTVLSDQSIINKLFKWEEWVNVHLLKRLESELAKYGPGTGGRDYWNISEGIANSNWLKRDLQIINYNI